ncbi:fimbrial protein [Rhodanobacter sp. B2A1Ga4]|uniref:fimbrial protein n=1 Tax=Rhodanobacter TaxID=75309 RepID=UPI000D334B28|nr:MULTISPECIES: fimbrial protein [Rhodanobacter]MBQ4854925.1 fimbrial protein [Rhodanobacter sp. B2A1Ga4]
MNKTLLCTALVAVTAALAPTAQAASSGTISFTGTVLADTCVIKINNSASNVVALPTVMAAAFGSAAGNVAGSTNFTVDLSNCDTNTASANMAFTAGTSIDSTTGNLKNATTGGSNVEIELLNGSAAINTSTQANAPVITVTGGAGSASLTAQYISTATATTAGLVTSSVGFTMTYM